MGPLQVDCLDCSCSLKMAPRKKKEAKYEKLLRKIYYTSKEAASFGGIQRLKEALHTKGKQGSQ